MLSGFELYPRWVPLRTRDKELPSHIILSVNDYEIILFVNSLQCRRILGGRNLVCVRNIVVVAIFDFMTVEDCGE